MSVHIAQLVVILIDNMNLDCNRWIVSSSLGQATYFHRDYSHPTAVTNTVNSLIFTAPKFGDFKILTYWCSLILVFSQSTVLLRYVLFSKSILKGATFKGKNILSFNSGPI